MKFSGKVRSDHGDDDYIFAIPRNRAMPRCATRGRGLLCFRTTACLKMMMMMMNFDDDDSNCVLLLHLPLNPVHTADATQLDSCMSRVGVGGVYWAVDGTWLLLQVRRTGTRYRWRYCICRKAVDFRCCTTSGGRTLGRVAVMRHRLRRRLIR